MEITEHIWFSANLNQEMRIKVYGSKGKLVLVFPQQEGYAPDFEGFGMVEACRHFIESGSVQLFCVDSVDAQSWANQSLEPAQRALRHEEYDRYLVQEVVPFMRKHSGKANAKCLTTGCSLGGYHAANFFFRHPDLSDGMICLSGLLDLRNFIGEYMDSNVYFNSPLDYLSNLNDPHYLNLYKQSNIIVCTGREHWEYQLGMVAAADRLKQIAAEKGIPAWIDYWGEDVAHDWPWWRKQLPYFLGKLRSDGKI